MKVLDFGLAKALEPTGAMSPGFSQSPTITTPAMTQAGMILGTAAYMSPEQAKGKTVDKRSDVWAFAVVLYEMLAGKRAFVGDDVSDTLAAVLRAEVNWDGLPEETPARLCQVLRACLQREPKQRVHDVADVRLALEGAFETTVSTPTGPTAVPQLQVWQRPVPVALAVLAALGLGGLAVWSLTPQPARAVARVMVGTTPATEPFSSNLPQRGLAISPDGTRIVYRASADGGSQLYVRPMDQLDGTSLFRAERDVANPFFSPDGAWVGFATNDDQTWKKVSILGGPPVTLFPGPGPPRGASWGPDDTIIFAYVGTGLFRGPAAGGEPEVLTTPDTEQGERFHYWSEILPGGEAVLFTIFKGAAGENEIAVLNLVTGEWKVLLPAGSNPHYAPTGHIVYGVDGTLQAVPFDLDRLEVTGDPVPVLEGVMTGRLGAVEFSLSADGSLVYVAGDAQGGGARSLVWVDRQGQEEPVTAPLRAYQVPRISPDGTQVALAIRDQERDIWVWDVARENLRRLTFDAGPDSSPVWTPDGQRVVFTSRREGADNLFWKATDGTGAVERLTDNPNLQFASAFSPDGTRLVFGEIHPETGWDLHMLSMEGDRPAGPLVATPFTERDAKLSPDARWIAYESNASGPFEIYVRPFPAVDEGQWLISTGGGQRPLWSSDGRELFYLNGAALMAVPIQTESTFSYGNPEVLFEGQYYTGPAGRTYDVSPDGQRFLMIKDNAGIDDTSAPAQIILVQNWFEELKRLVPVN